LPRVHYFNTFIYKLFGGLNNSGKNFVILLPSEVLYPNLYLMKADLLLSPPCLMDLCTGKWDNKPWLTLLDGPYL